MSEYKFTKSSFIGSDEELLHVTELDCSDCKITSLEGLNDPNPDLSEFDSLTSWEIEEDVLHVRNELDMQDDEWNLHSEVTCCEELSGARYLVNNMLFDVQANKLSLAEYIEAYTNNKNKIHTCISPDILCMTLLTYHRFDLFMWMVEHSMCNVHRGDELLFTQLCGYAPTACVVRWMSLFPETNIHVYDDISLCHACDGKHFETARYLISLGGVNVHSREDYVFIYGCRYGDATFVAWLLTQFPDVNKSSWGNAAVKLATHYGHSNILELLNEQHYHTLSYV